MRAKKDNFLVEIHTEELPPKALSRLAKSFLQEIKDRLTKAQLEFKEAEFYATPRRLAVFVKGLASEQPEAIIERKGPAIDAAFDAAGNPTPACIGFAKSCGTTPDKLARIKNKQGEFVGLQQTVPGKSVCELMPAIVSESLAALPIPKRMRWGSGVVEFVRPVHSVIMLYGRDVIDAEILGVRTGRETRGHRFHCRKTISISQPSVYLKRLEYPGYVIADFERRKAMILEQANAIVESSFGENIHPLITPELLDEVTGLVEWPVAILGDFDQRFLEVPSEALISAMQDHQRYFAVVDDEGKLLPHFVTISNIESRDMQRVIEGNERVLRARLSDAAFFFETDKKRSLESRLEILKGIVFQAKLGSVYDKTRRVSQLAAYIAKALGEDETLAARAGMLAKTDLTTEMVGEFPELQGLAGYYYAKHDGEPAAVATAMNEQYMPRFSGDQLPETKIGCILALADRLDTLLGVFGINQAPTGDKDPFALRRAALGVLRILIEKELNLDLQDLLTQGLAHYERPLENQEVVAQVLNFISERLKPWYQEQSINPDVFAAVAALGITRPYDFHRRIQAVQAFKQLQDAESLSVANKRVSNILAKYDTQILAKDIDADLFENDAERELASQLEVQSLAIAPLYGEARYMDVLSQLSHLRQPVDNFFDQVMVMTEDKNQRENRLLMLAKLRALFLQVADVALLQTR
ncbi:MAG: glycine--tRNA ligase subunit beta [Gammaproteobacteria bacterium]|nr:glycine--tRNA ligase subunit beta [Gammaproteobacteria bacterium]